MERHSLNNQDEINVANEIKIHSKLSHHFIIDYIESFYDNYYVYVVLGLAENGNLYMHIDPRNGMEVERAIKIFS